MAENLHKKYKTKQIYHQLPYVLESNVYADKYTYQGVDMPLT